MYIVRELKDAGLLSANIVTSV